MGGRRCIICPPESAGVECSWPPLLHRRGWKLPVQGFTADGPPRPAPGGEPEPFEIADMWCAGAAWGGELPDVGGNPLAGRYRCSLLSQRPQMMSPLCLLCPPRCAARLGCRPYWLDGWDPSTVHNSLSLDVRGMGLGGGCSQACQGCQPAAVHTLSLAAWGSGALLKWRTCLTCCLKLAT